MFGFAFGGTVFVILVSLSDLAFSDFGHILTIVGSAFMLGVFAQIGLEEAIEKIIKRNKEE